MQVLIADDHVMIRNGLAQLFDTMDGIAGTVQAANGEAALAALGTGRFDLLVLDLTMPGLSGIELIERIRAEHAQLPILVLSMHNEVQIVKRAVQAGANGFVTKGCSEDTLVSAICKVACGGRFIEPSIAEQMVFEKDSQGSPAPHLQLSARERQIMTLFAKGRSVKQIAYELRINDRTVSTHKTRLMRKLSLANNIELIRYVADHGLTERDHLRGHAPQGMTRCSDCTTRCHEVTTQKAKISGGINLEYL
ncbi:MAG: response regulator transcription factor [Rhodoferax sp.]|nr:response regulator transcription factor [Rhodoferax sp.]